MQKLLFVLDLNGTLLHRLTRAPDYAAALTHPQRRTADCSVRGCSIFFRPGREAFLRKLLGLGQVAVWTSAKPKNAVPMVLRLFSSLLDLDALRTRSEPHIQNALAHNRRLVQELASGPREQHQLLFLWTQEECTALPPPAAARDKFKPLFRKDLHRIWEHFPDYNAANTIMIDESREKLADHLDNLLCIEEFLVTDPLKDFTQDRVLDDLGVYLQHVSEACDRAPRPLDVRDYLRDNPFSRLDGVIDG